MRRRQRMLSPIVSNKNSFTLSGATGTTIVSINIAKAVDAPANTANDEVLRGSKIYRVWVSLDVCGLSATGVLQTTGIYLMKNPGTNLTPPSPFATGNSNEKKFIIKEWSAMTMRNQDGNPPYHWEGWVKIPKIYQRMGADDLLQLSFITDTAAGHRSNHFVYKYFS